MKKKIWGLVAVGLLTIGLAACGNSNTNKNASSNDDTTLKVGASPTPHAEILEHVQPLLKDEGINLEIVKFDDYVLPNQSLAEGDIDANYFQHIPYLNKEIKDKDYDFVNAGAIHIEPMGLYSKKLKNISDLKNGATVITSNSESDWGRIITILQEAGLVKVKDGVDLETATFDDIVENPKKLKFNHSIDPSLLASTYQNDEGDLVAINANFAYGAGLNPLKDAVLLEKDDSPYVNILVTRKGEENNQKIKKLQEVLHRKDVQNWIKDKWGGSVKPVDVDVK
ncbi:MetQ/NlpA family ABC transporter substrate-binding protein [Enterococcus ratti]|uniref:Lipoprotein n=1 Tax=Enterococcus ratti TaxID=150033 RepID=A0A1L8WPG9_9ENTE|nr:MetQ/NlpA family ABC transporter substrate-binding protein [Enterococcus ratti]OJG82722.1 pheromone cOB1 precursor/lipoprotein YaeC family [Enterococcus ratti]